MKSIKFPKMFNTNSTNCFKADEYNDATLQNTRLLLKTDRGEIISDPYFGLPIKAFMYEQNDYILREAFTDMIYTQIALFIPQIKVARNDVTIIQGKEKGKLYCRITGINQIDFSVNTTVLTLELETVDNN